MQVTIPALVIMITVHALPGTTHGATPPGRAGGREEGARGLTVTPSGAGEAFTAPHSGQSVMMLLLLRLAVLNGYLGETRRRVKLLVGERRTVARARCGVRARGDSLVCLALRVLPIYRQRLHGITMLR